MSFSHARRSNLATGTFFFTRPTAGLVDVGAAGGADGRGIGLGLGAAKGVGVGALGVEPPELLDDEATLSNFASLFRRIYQELRQYRRKRIVSFFGDF